jgi:hypothetical protein
MLTGKAPLRSHSLPIGRTTTKTIVDKITFNQKPLPIEMAGGSIKKRIVMDNKPSGLSRSEQS